MGVFDRQERGVLGSPLGGDTGGGGGEVNTASNLGAGQGVFAGKVGVDLQFKSLVAGTNITLTPSGTEILISATGGGAFANQNLSNLLSPTSINQDLVLQTNKKITNVGQLLIRTPVQNYGFPLEIGSGTETGAMALRSPSGASAYVYLRSDPYIATFGMDGAGLQAIDTGAFILGTLDTTPNGKPIYFLVDGGIRQKVDIATTTIYNNLVPDQSGLRTLGASGLYWQEIRVQDIFSNSNITLHHGSGSAVEVYGNVGGTSAARIHLYDLDSSALVGFKAPDVVTSTTVWTLPPADGTSGQVLQTSGTGVLSWVTPSGGDPFLGQAAYDDASNLIPYTWGPNVPALIFDGTTTEATTAFANGIILNGNDNDGAYLIFGTADRDGDTKSTSSVQIFTGFSLSGSTGGAGSIYVTPGGSNGTAGFGGSLYLQSGAVTNGANASQAGTIQIQGGNHSGAGPGGQVLIVGGQSNGGAPGGISITAGQTNAAGTISGGISISSGLGASGVGGASGAITLQTANVGASATSGDLNLVIGTFGAGGAQGDFKFHKAGTTVTAGHVWTATSADGKGYWAAPSGGSLDRVVKTGTSANVTISGTGSNAEGHLTNTGTSLTLNITGDGAHASGRFLSAAGTKSLNISGVGAHFFGSINDMLNYTQAGEGSFFIGQFSQTFGTFSMTGGGSGFIGTAIGSLTMSGAGSLFLGNINSTTASAILGSGILALGYTTSAGKFTSQNTSNGNLVGGYATGTNSTVDVTQSGGIAFGYVSGGGVIRSSANGGVSSGLASGGSAIVVASGQGAHASGYANGSGTITASGLGAIISGLSNGTMTSGGSGSVVFGSAGGGASLTATSVGSMAVGASSGTGVISGGSSANAGFANGYANSGTISIANLIAAGFAQGWAETSGTISVTANAGFASGHATGASSIITAGGIASMARGYATGGFDIAANGAASFAGGRTLTGDVISSGVGAFSWGDESTTSADFGTTFGLGHVNNTYLTAVFGRNSVTPGTANTLTWVSTDPLFVVGNGASTASRNNALEILKDGTAIFDGIVRPKTNFVDKDLGTSTYAWQTVYAAALRPNTGNLLGIYGDAGINYNSLAGAHTFLSNGNGIVVPNLVVDPGGPVDGEIWYNTSTNQLKAWVNGAPVILA